MFLQTTFVGSSILASGYQACMDSPIGLSAMQPGPAFSLAKYLDSDLIAPQIRFGRT